MELSSSHQLCSNLAATLPNRAPGAEPSLLEASELLQLIGRTAQHVGDGHKSAVVKFTTRLLNACINDGVAQFSFKLTDDLVLISRDDQLERVPLALSSVLALASSLLGSRKVKNASANVKRVLRELEQCCVNETMCAVFKELVWVPDMRARKDAAGCASLLDFLFASSWPEQLVLMEQFASLNSHPFHPMAKTKLPLTPSQVVQYSPEYAQHVPIMVAAVRSTHLATSASGEVVDLGGVDIDRLFQESFPGTCATWRKALLKKRMDPLRYSPLPIHPANLDKVQALFSAALVTEDIVLLPDVSLKCRALMSFRTMVPDLSYRSEGRREFPPHIKLPVAVQITSELRYLSPVEANDGPILTQLLLKLLRRHDNFKRTLYVLEENVGVHYNYDVDDRYEYENARFLSCIFRKSPCTVLLEQNVNEATVMLPLAALMTSTDANYLDERCLLLFEVIQRYHKKRTATDTFKSSVLRWFQEYTNVILQSMLRLFLVYGVALEAHQQNLLLVIDENGKVQKLLVRDLQVVCRERVLSLYDLVPTLHDREDSMLNEFEMYHAYNYFFHTTFVSNLIYLSGILATRYSTSQESYLDVIRSTVVEELSVAKEEARAQLGENTENFKAWLEHRDHAKQSILGKTYQHKCLLKMRCAGNKYETYSERVNALYSESTWPTNEY